MDNRVFIVAAAGAATAFSCSAFAQCASGWQPVGSYPGTSHNPIVIAWDPDADGPASEVILAQMGGTAGSESRAGVAKWDGTRWSVMGTTPVTRAAAYEDGTLYAWRYSAFGHSELVRWNRDAQDWELIADGPSGVNHMITLADGDVAMVGTFRDFHGYDYAVRWDAQSQDFAPLVSINGVGMRAFRTESKVLVTGAFTEVAGQPCGGIAMQTAGSTDWIGLANPESASRPNTNVEQITEYQGDLLLASPHRGYRFDLDTGTWTRVPTPFGFQTFNLDAFAALPNGDLLAVGFFREYINVAFRSGPLVVQSAATGQWSFPFTHSVQAFGLCRRSDGSVVVTGPPVGNLPPSSLGNRQLQGTGLFAWSPASNAVEVFGDGLPVPATCLLAEDDGTVLVVGPFGSVGNLHTGSVARWDPQTREFSAFRVPCPLFANFAFRRASGSLVVGGADEAGLMAVMQLAPDADSWQPLGTPWPVASLPGRYFRFVEAASGVLVSLCDGRLRSLAPGGADWHLVASTPTVITSIAEASNGRVAVAGDGVFLWDPATDTFEPLGIDSPLDVAVLLRTRSGKLVALGANARRLNAVSGIWEPLGDGDPGRVKSATLLADGDILMTCDFLTSSSQTTQVPNIARWDASSDTWSLLYATNDYQVLPGVMAETVNGDLVVSGEFDLIGPRVFSPRFALYRGIVPPCPSDFDCSRSVDSDDVITFFGAWDARFASADFNKDGTIDGDDVQAFFAAWDSGC